MLAKLFGRGVPAYLWIAVFYVVYVLIISVPEVAGSMFDAGDEASSVENIENVAPADDEAILEDAQGSEQAQVPAAEPTATEQDPETLTRRVTDTVEDVLRAPLFHVPLFSGVAFPVTWTTFFIIAGFVSAWIEALRATNVRASGNDFMSLIVTIVTLILFVGVPWFGTTAFMIVPLVGLGDLLLDRYIGQAVARRDFGSLYGPGGGGGGE